MLKVVVFLVLLLGLYAAQEERDFYRAAVFEHVTFGDPLKDSPNDIIDENLRIYNTVVKKAKEKEANIIVFPEYGIFPPDNRREGIRRFLETIPNPEEGEWNPCLQKDIFQDRRILTNLSCLAHDNELVVVANMGDLQPCNKDEDSKCPEDGRYQFNTNVAFGRDGNLLARYHKIHLLFEYGFDAPPVVKSAVFKTDFETFATAISFDVQYEEIYKSAKQPSVGSVVMTNRISDSLPISIALYGQQAFAMATGVNVLAASAHKTSSSILGSGIYSPTRGALKYTYNPDNLSKLLVAKVPLKSDVTLSENDSSMFVIIDDKIQEKSSPDGDKVPEECSLKLLGKPVNPDDHRCGERDTSEYSQAKLVKPSDTLELCKNGMCCSLSYTAKSMDEDYYLLLNNGIRSVGNKYFLCEEACFLVRCDPIEDKPCSTFPLRSQTVFSELNLSANFTAPSVLTIVSNSGVRLAPATEWETKRSTSTISLQSQTSSDPLISAILYGRCFQRDQDDNH